MSINSLLDNNTKQRDICRSQLASIISATSMLECLELIDKVSESGYLKVRARQISKFNRLLQKEGNLTWSSTLPELDNSAGLASTPSQPGRNTGRAGAESQADSVSFPQPGRKACSAGTQSQAGNVSPQAGSVSTQADRVSPPSREVVQALQALLLRQTGVSVTAKVLLALQQGMLLLPQTVQLVSPGTKAETWRVGALAPQPEQVNSMSSRGFPSNQEGNIQEDPSHMLVINLSSKPLTHGQRSLLVKGPNYAIAPRHPLT